MQKACFAILGGSATLGGYVSDGSLFGKSDAKTFRYKVFGDY